MNRDELLAACFPAADSFDDGAREFKREEVDGNVAHVRALVTLDYRRIIVFPPTGPGSGISNAAFTMTIAALSNIGTDPAFRGKGYASALIRSAHEEAATHESIEFAAVFASPEFASFFEQFGYAHPDGTAAGFLVAALAKADPATGEPLTAASWPEGRVDTRGKW